MRDWHERWGEDGINWALSCGEVSNVVVIDIDTKQGRGYQSMDDFEQARGALPSTLRSATGGGGRHLFFTYPAGIKVKNRVGWMPNVDVRSDGGYVILPPGEHISGGSYVWENWGEAPAELPLDVAESISTTAAGWAGGGGSIGGSDLPDTSEILKGIPEGSRDNTLFLACCRWRRQLRDDRAAVVALATIAAMNCEPPFPQDQAMKCVDSAFKQDHIDSGPVLLPGHTGDGYHPLTDLGNARRLFDTFGGDILYAEGMGWMSWRGNGWHRDASGTFAMSHKLGDIVQQEADALQADGSVDVKTIGVHQKWAKQCQQLGTMNNAVGTLINFSDIRRSVEDFDSDDDVLACSNGILDLKTGRLRPMDRTDLTTYNTGIEYVPGYTDTRWNNFLLESCQGDLEMIEYLQRAAGYTLTGSTREEVFFMLSGPPASGKSTYLDGLQKMLGSYGSTTQPDTFMARRNGGQTHSSELARLVGRRMVAMSELREGESYDESIVKQFTGGDLVTARFLYQEAFEFRPKLKLWIATNNDPNVHDDAMWRRMRKVPFYNSIPAERRDPRLKAFVRDPGTGGKAILAWAVEGAMKWYVDGLGPLPTRLSMELDQYHAAQDRGSQFIDDTFIRDSNSMTKLKDVYASYNGWALSMNERPKRMPQFVEMLNKRGCSVTRGDDGQQYVIGLRAKVIQPTFH